MLNHRSLRKTLLSLCQYLLASLNRKLGMAFVVIVWYTNKECVPLFAASGKWSEALWCGSNLLTLICCVTLCQTKTCIVSCVQLIAIIFGALGNVLPEQVTIQCHTHSLPWPTQRSPEPANLAHLGLRIALLVQFSCAGPAQFLKGLDSP